MWASTLDYQDATLSVIDAASDAVTRTLALPIEPSGSRTSVAITPDGKKAYVAYNICNDGTGSVGQYRLVVVDVDPASPTYHDMEVITTTGSRLEDVVISAEVERAYTGDHPFGVTSGLDLGVAYVANTDSTVVRIARVWTRIFLPLVLCQ
jgi:DNA-binding beta-propeller fold protein YncE